ncbi:hypothetical protein E3P92_03884 [Wallemia ichthyophaga]|nr:hypothetical protein E3P91_03937 [Wallemia ichthyophaga]TIB08096.1 hypothetical protein E3P92_03884 [Wallemia ichthyophaga]TIB58463.1 hypothetical protein E3P78_03917 [Wallemia ichthyophaga]
MNKNFGRSSDILTGEMEHGYSHDNHFDPAADFNNLGPRYVPFFPQADSHPGTPATEHTQLTHDGSEAGKDDKDGMLTVPAMGADWHADELKGISKSHRRKEANWDRKRAAKGWFRGQRKCCGISRKTAVFMAFGGIISLILLLYFLIPRTPTFTFRSTVLNLEDEDSPSFLTYPTANFSFDGSVAVSLDTTTSWIPITVKHLDATVYDAVTNTKVGEGGFKKSKSYSRDNDIHVDVPVHFSYEASDDSDPTWSDWHDACKHQWKGQPPPTTLSIRLKLDMQIQGLTKTTTVSQSSDSDVACPFELSADSP